MPEELSENRAAKMGCSTRRVQGVFDECRATCSYWRTHENDGGGTEHDCAHPDNSPHLSTKETPCDARLCPIFRSDDEEGDRENWRADDEIEGEWLLVNDEDRHEVRNERS